MGTETLAIRLAYIEARLCISLRSCGVLACGFLVLGRHAVCHASARTRADKLDRSHIDRLVYPGNWNTDTVPTAADLVQINTITPNATVIAGGPAVAAGTDIGNVAGSQGAVTGDRRRLLLDQPRPAVRWHQWHGYADHRERRGGEQRRSQRLHRLHHWFPGYGNRDGSWLDLEHLTHGPQWWAPRRWV